MVKGLECKVSGTISGKSLAMKASYSGRNSFPSYMPVGMLNSLQAGYTQATSLPLKYLRPIIDHLSAYPNIMLKSYSIKPRAESSGYRIRLSEKLKNPELRCLRCGANMKAFGNCEMCGWGPYLKNVKKRYLSEQ